MSSFIPCDLPIFTWCPWKNAPDVFSPTSIFFQRESNVSWQLQTQDTRPLPEVLPLAPHPIPILLDVSPRLGRSPALSVNFLFKFYSIPIWIPFNSYRRSFPRFPTCLWQMWHLRSSLSIALQGLGMRFMFCVNIFITLCLQRCLQRLLLFIMGSYHHHHHHHPIIII